MRNAALVGQDSAGGVIIGQGNQKLTVSGKFAAQLGDRVAGHGRSPHDGPVMIQASTKLTVDGVPICLQGHAASCGHTATGTSKLTVSS